MIDGHVINLDATDSLLLSVNGEYEPLESRIFTSCLHDGATVIDVGGHIGLYTLQAARAVGPSGTVIVFEPAPDNFQLLKRNISENGYNNVTLVPRAVSDHSGSELLIVSADNTGDNRLADSSVDENVVTVETVSLDDYFAGEYPKVDVIKMDIQGSEPLAFAGARGLIAASDELVLFTELSNGHISNDRMHEFFVDLGAAGFELFEIGESVEPVTADAIAERFSAANGQLHTDLACVKGRAAMDRFLQAISLN